ncbi:pyruvate/2-oxoglutarate dehydrogenase complex, dihydrolipoamide acyltransferase (E2) component [Longilinea arvoryzae]|uniref:Dihydrolipoamide acetyltransferase component of pyruvate dehydrogenase complex n=1 Tax=Longilinea arvoryzae TaxID=360412 RepID=A0A0S7BC14_9CHLR|nr:dihydrolipoamide acetyltransferase family protein [Longilinea arvoryzae]GAP15407.1 pyruvate/2-oxoglutarate dehydrogenase complex, dihydrolipoamide acyltransferase (E2) component [Longilinea arvoryzae]
MATKVIMPQLGESVVEGTVMQWLKHEGDQIAEFESLLEINTDKVNSEIPSPASGVLLKILVPEGETVSAGSTIAWIGQPGESLPEGAPDQTPRAEPARAAPSATSVPTPVAVGRDRELGFISPVVARLARDHNVDLHAVKGSGEGGRITKKDVLAYLGSTSSSTQPSGQAEPAAWETPGEGDLFRPTEMMFPTQPPAPVPQTPPVPPAVASQPPAAGNGRLVPHSQMRKRIAEHMLFSKNTAPHVTTVMEANLQQVVAHREANKPLFARDGVKLTYTAYFMAAAAAALRANPLVNSSWREDGVWIHDAVNIGMATSLGEEGLIVPVIQQADGLSLLGLARIIEDLAGRARGHRLQPDEVQGGTFTITNHGTAGSLFATPIINQPQCAILGVGAIQKRVVVLENDAIAVRPMVYLSLTFDHRILDGDSADRFLSKIVSILEKWS